jgi:hypothetical protein
MSDSRNPSSSPEPDLSARQQLVESLRVLERDPTGDESARRHLHAWLADDSPLSPHPELHELQTLAKRRTGEGADFQLPDHLLSCKVCMEIFRVLCEEASQQTPMSATEGGTIRQSTSPQPGEISRARSKTRGLMVFASVFLLSLVLWIYLKPPGIILESGVLLHKNETLAGGQLPARQWLEALQQTELSFLDGSRIVLEPGARIRSLKTLRFQPLFVLESGEARFDFRDSRTAPRLRSGDLQVLPSASTFEINASPENITLQVFRGEINILLGKETRRLREGETLKFP